MARSQLEGAVRLLRQMDDASFTDRQLLEAFAAGERATSFSRLVDRHGPMVYGVCKRVLRNAADADDAFQATFLVLAKQAPSRGWHDSIANYLYGVAYRTALRVRGRAARRKHHEEHVPPRPDSLPVDHVSMQELRSAVDEELTRLPEKFRLPVLLCCLHDRTIEEAAATLGLPPTTVKGRLQQGRDALRSRLANRGITVGAGLLATLSLGGTATAVPTTLFTQTVQLAVSDSNTGPVAALMQEELTMLFWKKAKAITAVLSLITVIGGGIMTMATSAAPVPLTRNVPNGENRGKASAPVEKDGLEVTLRSTKEVYRTGERITVEVTYTNRSKQAMNIDVSFHADNIKFWELSQTGTPAWRSKDWTAIEYEKVRLNKPHELAPGADVTVVYPVEGPFSWRGEQSAPRAPLGALPPGEYTANCTILLPKLELNGQAAPLWTGVIEGKPIMFRIADLDGSVPAIKDGLAVTTRPIKPVFVTGEQLNFDVTLSNTSAATFRLRDLDLATDTWLITKVDGTGSWQSGPFGYTTRAVGAVYRLDPTKVGGLQTEIVYPKVVRGPFVWKGRQSPAPVPLNALAPGKYKAVVKLSFPAVKDNNPIPNWAGQLESNPVEFTIAENVVAAPSEPVVVTEDPNVKTVKVKVGQTVNVRLVSNKKLQGWESGSAPAKSTLTANGDRPRFSPAPNAADESVGTYLFSYTATGEGSVNLDFKLLSPSGPTVTRRTATELVREFSITVEVEK